VDGVWLAVVLPFSVIGPTFCVSIAV